MSRLDLMNPTISLIIKNGEEIWSRSISTSDNEDNEIRQLAKYGSYNNDKYKLISSGRIFNIDIQIINDKELTYLVKVSLGNFSEIDELNIPNDSKSKIVNEAMRYLKNPLFESVVLEIYPDDKIICKNVIWREDEQTYIRRNLNEHNNSFINNNILKVTSDDKNKIFKEAIGMNILDIKLDKMLSDVKDLDQYFVQLSIIASYGYCVFLIPYERYVNMSNLQGIEPKISKENANKIFDLNDVVDKQTALNKYGDNIIIDKWEVPQTFTFASYIRNAFAHGQFEFIYKNDKDFLRFYNINLNRVINWDISLNVSILSDLFKSSMNIFNHKILN
ncbi:hypothetical protein HDV06_001129 [Boothiomyces sp. JEL0866]|nr:hypothetical protein HDV06_001129 [Boothiomyces sp. JEL0866]